MVRPLIYGHRGAKAHARENTVEAFALAIEQGADGVELDLRRSGDGALIIHHDDRAGPSTPPFITQDLTAIRAASPWVPTLDEAWAAVGDEARFNIEVKNVPGEADFDPSRRIADDLVRWADGRDGRDRILVSSFDLDALAMVRRDAPSLATGQLTAMGVHPMTAIEWARRDGHVSVHLPTAAVLDHAAAIVDMAGPLDVLVWTVNDPDVASALADGGVAGIFTDDPALIIDRLG